MIQIQRRQRVLDQSDNPALTRHCDQCIGHADHAQGSDPSTVWKRIYILQQLTCLKTSPWSRKKLEASRDVSLSQAYPIHIQELFRRIFSSHFSFWKNGRNSFFFFRPPNWELLTDENAEKTEKNRTASCSSFTRNRGKTHYHGKQKEEGKKKKVHLELLGKQWTSREGRYVTSLKHSRTQLRSSEARQYPF